MRSETEGRASEPPHRLNEKLHAMTPSTCRFPKRLDWAIATGLPEVPAGSLLPEQSRSPANLFDPEFYDWQPRPCHLLSHLKHEPNRHRVPQGTELPNVWTELARHSHVHRNDHAVIPGMTVRFMCRLVPNGQLASTSTIFSAAWPSP